MTIEATLERIAVALERLASAPATGLPPAGEAAAPKVERKKRAATVTEPVTSTETPTSAPADAPPASESTDKETDDLFGEEKPKEEVKKAKAATMEDVRAALVQVQTALKHKDHALKLLGKHTVPKGTQVLSKLPEANYAALIAEAAESVKAGKVAD